MEKTLVMTENITNKQTVSHLDKVILKDAVNGNRKYAYLYQFGDNFRRVSSFNSFQEALNSDFNLVVDSGNHIVSELILSKSKKIIGENNSVITQITTLDNSTPILKIVCDNVILENLSFVGQIQTQIYEWSPAIMIGDHNIKGCNNINLLNIKIQDCRGDGIYITDTVTEPTRNVRISNIKINNCLRNGVSIISGSNVEISNLTADNIGLCGIDIEPDVVEQYVSNVKVSNCFIPSLFAGQSSPNMIEAVSVNDCIIDNDLKGSNPTYLPGVTASKSPIQIRNVRNLKFENNIIKNSELEALKFIASTLNSENILFNNCNFIGNCKDNACIRLIDVEGTHFNGAVTFMKCNFIRNGLNERYLGGPSKVFYADCKISGYERVFEVTGGTLQNCNIEVIGYVSYYQSDDTVIRDSKINCYSVFYADSPLCDFKIHDCDIEIAHPTNDIFNGVGNLNSYNNTII